MRIDDDRGAPKPQVSRQIAYNSGPSSGPFASSGVPGRLATTRTPRLDLERSVGGRMRRCDEPSDDAVVAAVDRDLGAGRLGERR